MYFVANIGDGTEQCEDVTYCTVGDKIILKLVFFRSLAANKNMCVNFKHDHGKKPYRLRNLS